MNRYFQTLPVVKNLIIINLLIYMAMALIPEARLFLDHFGALQVGPRMLGYDFHAYQFITYMFLHANFEHIFFNMFALWMFGRRWSTTSARGASWSTTWSAASVRR